MQELTVLLAGLVVGVTAGTFGRRRGWGARQWGVAAATIVVGAVIAVALVARTVGTEPPSLRAGDGGTWINYLTVDGPHDEVAEVIDDAGGWVLNHIDDPIDGERTSAVFDVESRSEAEVIAEQLRDEGYRVLYPWPAATVSGD